MCIRDSVPLVRLDPRDRVFVHVDAVQLQAVCKLALREVVLLAELDQPRGDQIALAVWGTGSCHNFHILSLFHSLRCKMVCLCFATDLLS